MSNELIAVLMGAVAGSISTGIISLILLFSQMKLIKKAEIEKENRQLKVRKIYFSEALLFDLENSINLYDRLKSDYDKTKSIWFEHLSELREYRSKYEQFHENILLFSEPLRKRVFNYYAKTKWLINVLQDNQLRKQEIRSRNNKFDSFESCILSEIKQGDELNELENHIKLKLDELIGFKQEAAQIMQIIEKEVGT